MPSNPVEIRIMAESADDLEAAKRRLEAAGGHVDWYEGPKIRSTTDTYAYGQWQLYDTPETVEAKARAAGSIVRAAIQRFGDV